MQFEFKTSYEADMIDIFEDLNGGLIPIYQRKVLIKGKEFLIIGTDYTVGALSHLGNWLAVGKEDG